MILSDIKDWFNTSFNSNDLKKLEQVSVGKIDENLEHALCFYDAKPIEYINKLGVSTYSIKPLTILLRFGKNQKLAEEMINKIFNFLDKKKGKIQDKNVMFSHKYETPISLGTDDKGIFEFSIEIIMYYKKEES